MFATVKMFFATLTTLFSATNKLANALNHGAEWAEGEAAGFNEIKALERAQVLAERLAEFSEEDRARVQAHRDNAKGVDKPKVLKK